MDENFNEQAGSILAEDWTPTPARRPFWDYQDLLIVLGLSIASFFVVMLLGSLLVTASPKIRSDPTAVLLPLQMVLYGFIYLSFRFTFSSRYGRPVFVSLGWKRVPIQWAAMVAGGVILAFFVVLIAAALHTPQIDSPMDKLTKTPLAIIFFAIFAVVIGPLSEELVFRGFLQPLLGRTFGTGASIVMTALIFGSLHGPEYSWAWQYILAVSLAGLVFGVVRARTDSVIPSTVMHACYNAVFVVALLITKFPKLK